MTYEIPTLSPEAKAQLDAAARADNDLWLTDLTPTHEALALVVAERRRQIAKWGGPEGDGIENPSTSNYVRLRVLAEEFGEVAEAMGRPEDGNGKRDLRTELVQVAAVAVAWLEALYSDGSSTNQKGDKRPICPCHGAPLDSDGLEAGEKMEP